MDSKSTSHAKKNNKKKTNEKSAETVEIVKNNAKSNEVANIVIDINNAVKNQLSSASKLTFPPKKKSKGTENSKTKSKTENAKIVGTNLNNDDINTKGRWDIVSVTNTKEELYGKGKNKAKKKSKTPKTTTEAKTLSVRDSVSDHETHSLDYSPETVLIEAEEDLHEGSKFDDIHGSVDQHVCDVEVQSDVAETHSKDVAGQHFEGPSKYKDGTPGGRLFKEETLAEMDAYLYLGKVSCQPCSL